MRRPFTTASSDPVGAWNKAAATRNVANAERVHPEKTISAFREPISVADFAETPWFSGFLPDEFRQKGERERRIDWPPTKGAGLVYLGGSESRS